MQLGRLAPDGVGRRAGTEVNPAERVAEISGTLGVAADDGVEHDIVVRGADDLDARHSTRL